MDFGTQDNLKSQRDLTGEVISQSLLSKFINYTNKSNLWSYNWIVFFSIYFKGSLSLSSEYLLPAIFLETCK